MVSVIAAVLESHLGMERETWNIDPEYFRGQARAVLAAISEAGAVEWGTEHVAQGSRTIEIHPCDSEADAQGAIAYYGGRILSRITGPWERAE